MTISVSEESLGGKPLPVFCANRGVNCAPQGMANSGFILVARQWQGFFCFQETSPNVDSCCGACSSQALDHQSSPTHSSWRKTETAVIKTSRSLGGRAALPFASVCVWSWRWRWWKAWAWTSAVHEMQHGHVAPAFLLPHCSGVVWRHKPPWERRLSLPCAQC